MGATFKPNPDFLDQWARTSAVLRGKLDDMADKIADAARSRATGTIARGIDTDSAVIDGVPVARVNSSDFRTAWFEYGTVKMRPRPFMVPGVYAAGYRLSKPTQTRRERKGLGRG